MKQGSQQDFLRIPVLGLVPEGSATAPADPVAGQLWTDTSQNPPKVRWYDGTQWVTADGSGIPNATITDAMVAANAAIALSKLAVDPLARANHTGIQLAATISDFDTQVRASRLDQMALPTANLDVNNQRLVNVANPVAATDAVNKTYVDNARAGISVKDPVRVAATGNVNLATPGASMDGVAMAPGDRFLATAQTTGTENGIYEWTGAASAAIRAYDADTAGDVVDGTVVAVAEGATAGTQFIQTASATGAPGTWTQIWTTFSTGGQTYVAGTGLDLVGSTFSLETPVALANGGTGATDAAGARAALGVVGKYAADLAAMTAGQALTVTHNLGTDDVTVSFRTTADKTAIDFSWRNAAGNTNAIEVLPDLAFAAGAVRVVVTG